MNGLLKNSKLSQKNGFPAPLRPPLARPPSWVLSSLSRVTQTLVLASLVLLILRDKGCALCCCSCPVKPVSLDIRRFSPKEVHNDGPIEGILVHLTLSLWPSNPTFCHRNDFLPEQAAGSVCPLCPLPAARPGGRSSPHADLLSVSIWLRALAVSGCVLRSTPLQERGTVDPEGQESYLHAERLS